VFDSRRDHFPENKGKTLENKGFLSKSEISRCRLQSHEVAQNGNKTTKNLLPSVTQTQLYCNKVSRAIPLHFPPAPYLVRSGKKNRPPSGEDGRWSQSGVAVVCWVKR